MVPNGQFPHEAGKVVGKALQVYASKGAAASISWNREMYTTDMSYLLDTRALSRNTASDRVSTALFSDLPAPLTRRSKET